MIDAGSIAEIICDAPQGTIDYFCKPEAIKRAPELSIQAKFSLYFAVAVGATKAPEISDFLPEHLTAPQLLQMAHKIHCRIGGEYTSEEAVIAPVTVHIRTAGGQEFTRRIAAVYGHPSNPITDQDLRAKFLDCMQYARNPVSTEQSNALFDAILGLDSIVDISEISALLP